MDDDLAPSKTEGFKVGEKKTIDEYKNLGRVNSIPMSLRRQSFQASWIRKVPRFGYLGGLGICIMLKFQLSKFILHGGSYLCDDDLL
jgi:hypothetical protein